MPQTLINEWVGLPEGGLLRLYEALQSITSSRSSYKLLLILHVSRPDAVSQSAKG